jgi:hypothetical protein
MLSFFYGESMDEILSEFTVFSRLSWIYDDDLKYYI